MGSMASQITNLTIVSWPFIQVRIKENIKAPYHWPLCGEFTDDRWIPVQMASNGGKCFHLMTSWWSMVASHITGISIVTQPFIQVHIKENIEAPHNWPLWREFTSDRWIPLTKGQLRSPATGGFPPQRASNAENVSIWWRHHAVPTAFFQSWILNI